MICECYLRVRFAVLENNFSVYFDDTAVGRGINGIGYQIGKDLAHFAAKRFNLQFSRDLDFGLDGFVTKLALKHPQYIVQ